MKDEGPVDRPALRLELVCSSVGWVVSYGLERVHLAVPVPRGVAGAALAGVELPALRSDAEEALVRRREGRRAGLRIRGLVEERQDLIRPHLPVLRRAGGPEPADDQRRD